MINRGTRENRHPMTHQTPRRGTRPKGKRRIVKHLATRHRAARRVLSRRQLLSGAAAMAGTLVPATYVAAVAPFDFQFDSYDLPVPNLSPEFEGFRIAQLTDIHVGFNVTPADLRKIVHRVNALGVDAVVLTGDYADHGPENLDAAWAELAELRAPSGVYGVLGNHDHWISRAASLEWLEKTGFSVRHTARPIEKGDARIWIGGAGALWNDHLGIDRAFSNVPETDCRICLSHYPDAADEPFAARVDLMLAGHTHGGQVHLPGLPKFWTRHAVRNPDYMAGLIATPKTMLFVSRGIGCYVVPVRINCPPEVAVLTLRSAGV